MTAEGRNREIDDAVTRRIAEIASAAGVPHSRAALEVLYYLPKDFLDRYAELFNASLRLDSGGMGSRGVDEQPVKVSSEYRGKRPMTGAGGKRYKEYWVVLSDEALDIKKKVDKRLRGLAREIAGDLRMGDTDDESGNGQRVKCGRCGQFLAGSWKFCPECGTFRPHGD